ncbi:DinB family protein [Rossellomorea sp. SC111]|uniref:DinB family protein n=1 Tax=Rossellomorea sp. SC111 TaxID=2968985 RepID=UPI00215B4759|nr:DinB family protein [Rossellomorea sp. SC111]MCR8849073.1 DinB family protein [Rossellomorea sp. SC111]
MWETKIVEIREKVKESIEGLSYEKLNQKPSQEEWSIAQIVLHLAGAEMRFLTLALDSAESGGGRSDSDVDLSVFDDPSQKLLAPIEPSTDLQTMEDLMKALEESRSLTTCFLKKYTKEGLNHQSMHHHRFGDMPIWQVLELLGKHEQRHLMQMEDVKKRIR